MRRVFLLFFLAFFLCLGLLQNGQELLAHMENYDLACFKEAMPLGNALCIPKPNQCFAQIMADEKQPLLQPRLNSQVPRRPSVAWRPTTRGQKRRVENAIQPSEWGLTVLQLPRSDG